MLEIEMKFPVADFAAVAAALRTWGARRHETRVEADRYFNAPDRDFAQTDEALRIRSVGERNFVTYKGPKIDPQTKTRTEIEVPLGPGPATAERFGKLLQRLGYRFTLLVEKRRQIHSVEREGFHLKVCLDEVAGLGKFVELEITAPDEQLERARRLVRKAARELGLEQSERRSYLEMLLEQRT